MAYACEYCGKTFDIGHKVSHAKNRTLTKRRPNLHEKRVVEMGTIIRRLLCIKCGRMAERPHQAERAALRKAAK